MYPKHFTPAVPRGKYPPPRAASDREQAQYDAALDRELLRLVLREGGTASLRALFDRGYGCWRGMNPAPNWAMETAERLCGSGLARLDGKTLTVTAAGRAAA